MKSLLRPVTLLLARLGRALMNLQAGLGRWAPQPSPALVPIPVRIRTERHTPDAVERRRQRNL